MFISNIRVFVLKNRAVFSIVVLCILCSSLMIYISAGLIYHYQQKSFYGDGSKRSVTILFNEAVCVDDPVTKGELEEFFKSEDIFDDLQSFYCETNEYDDDGNIANTLVFYTQYKNGKFVFDKKTQQAFLDDMVLKEGEFFTDEQYSNGERTAIVADLNAFENKTTVNVLGKPYKIIGRLDPFQGYYVIYDVYIPFTCLDDSQPLEWGLNFEYNEPLNTADVKQLVTYAQEHFGDRITFDGYDRYYDFDMSKYYGSLGASCALICLLACFNFILLYRYILSVRIDEYRIFRICGATRFKLAIEFAKEIFALSFPVLIISAAIFEIIIKKYIVDFYEYSSGAYGSKLYIIVICIYLIATVISSVLMFLVHFAGKKTV